MKIIDKHKHKPWLWLTVSGLLLFVWLFGFFLLFSTLGGCESEPVCEPGERACVDNEVLQCDRSGHWGVWVDCQGFESADQGIDNWECCTINSKTNCYPRATCELVGRYCKTIEELQGYCEDDNE